MKLLQHTIKPAERKDISSFFLKLALGAVILFTADRLVGFLLRRLYFSQVAGDISRVNYSMDSTRADVIVFGSSRASHHYVPEIFENILGKSFYNAGRDGSPFVVSYAIYKAVLKRHTPEMVIIEFSPKQFYCDWESYDKLSIVSPYYETHPEIREIIKLKGRMEEYKFWSAVYPFNSQLVSLVIGRLKLAKDSGLKTKGYLPLYQKLKHPPPEDFSQEPVELIDSVKTNALDDIANVCRQKNIRLVFICSPVLGNAANIKANEEIKKITEKYKIEFWDFSDEPTFDQHPEYFKDNGHMNDQGARLFSTIIATKIKEKKYLQGYK